MSKIIDEKIKKIINHLGIKLEERDLQYNYAWNGKTLSISGLKYNEIFHEIAHWMVADEEHKNLPEYGLGPSSYITEFSNICNSKPMQSCNCYLCVVQRTDCDDEKALACDNEEALASIFGITLEASIGTSYVETLEDHGWYSAHNNSWCSSAHPHRLLFELRKMGLLIKHNPKILLDLNLVPPDLIGAPLLTLKYINKQYRNKNGCHDME